MVSFQSLPFASKTNLSHIRAMLHDPSGQLNPEVRDPNTAFGFGRRLCPGRELAFDSMSITMASILATFDILPVVDENGVVAVVSGEYSSGLIGKKF
jgi:cytochrome P450